MKEYIGDGVYAEIDQFRDLVLTTENGIEVTNRIVLEMEVLHDFVNFIHRHYPLVK